MVIAVSSAYNILFPFYRIRSTLLALLLWIANFVTK